MFARRVDADFIAPMKICKPVDATLSGLPTGAVLLSRVQIRMWGDWCTSEEMRVSNVEMKLKKVMFGVFHTPDKFLERALELEQIFDCPDAVS